MSKAYVRAAILSLTFVAFILRVYQLDSQSLWWDEVLSAVIVREPFLAMLDKSAEYLHPPLYYIVLFLWTRIAGISDWALRFPSAAVGTALVPLLFVVGRRLSGNSLGLLAAIVAALSPLLVHYSQETRDYSLAVTLSLASAYLLLVAIDRGGSRAWAVWGGVSILAAYTEYLALLVFAAQVASYLAFCGLRRRWPGVPSLSATLAIPVSLIPWLLYRRSIGGPAGDIVRGSDLTTILRDTLATFNLGTAIEVEDAIIPALFILAVAIAGAFLHRRRLGAALFVMPSLVVPILALYLLSVGRRDFAVRYVLVAYPFYALLLALGLDWLWAGAKLPATLVVLAVSLAALFGVDSYYHDYHFSRDDFRGAARYYDDQVRAGDVIVFNAAWGQMAFDYYSSRGSPSVGVTRSLPLDEVESKRVLSDLASRYDRIWLASWQDYFSDPGDRIKTWLDANTTQMAARSFRLITLTLYRTAPVVMRSTPKIQNPAQVDFDNGVRFLGYDLDTSDLSDRGRLYVTLYWQAKTPVTRSFNVYVKLTNPAYHVWGQKDNRPVYDRIPTDVWQVGEIFRDEYALDVLPGTPPGSYRLAVGLYDPASWVASRIAGGGLDHLALGPVAIPRTSRSPTITQPKKVGFADSIQLLGYDLASDWKPGSGLHLTLYWQATGVVPQNYTVFNHLLDGSGKLISQKDSQPADGTYPTSKWQPGEIVRDQYDIEIPKDVSPGSLSLRIGVYDGATGERLALRDKPKANFVSLGGFSLRP